MKKKVLAILLGVVAALGIAAAGGYIYLVNNPEICFLRVKPVNPDTDFYFSYPTIVIFSVHDGPLPAPKEEKVAEFMQWMDPFISNFQKTYTAPTKVVVYAEVKDGKTRFWHEGTVTKKDGETVPYFEEKIFDWVLVPDEALSELKTSPF